MIRTKDDLFIQLQECSDALMISCKAFDDGYHSEAKRIATVIRVLLHDTQKSKSLLSQLKLKTSKRYLTTYIPPLKDNKIKGHHALLHVGLDKKLNLPTFIAPRKGGNNNKWVTFETWWNENVLTTDHFCATFNRRELIHFLVNKDGGAHVDPELPLKYAVLSRQKGMGYFRVKGSDTSYCRIVSHDNKVDEIYQDNEPILGVELYTIRQIGYEILISLKKRAPSLQIDLSKL